MRAVIDHEQLIDIIVQQMVYGGMVIMLIGQIRKMITCGEIMVLIQINNDHVRIDGMYLVHWNGID
jgi:hypothetical protein